MLTLDAKKCFSGICLIERSDLLAAEIKPTKEGTYHLALCLLKSRKAISTSEAVSDEHVAPWLNAHIKSDYSAAFTIDDFEWKEIRQSDLILLLP